MAMTMTSTGTGSAPDTISTDLIRTARTTGLLYLAFFITGISGSMLVRSQLFAADDAHALCRQGVPCGLGCEASDHTKVMGRQLDAPMPAAVSLGHASDTAGSPARQRHVGAFSSAGKVWAAGLGLDGACGFSLPHACRARVMTGLFGTGERDWCSISAVRGAHVSGGLTSTVRKRPRR